MQEAVVFKYIFAYRELKRKDVFAWYIKEEITNSISNDIYTLFGSLSAIMWLLFTPPSFAHGFAGGPDDHMIDLCFS